MRGYFSKKRVIALFMAVLFAATNLVPVQAFALTSGPAQPEMSSFQPAGLSKTVDLFTGDFKYDIPLVEIDGYPINLSYQSGVGMDDEASWVGLGWNVNVGSVNRQLRGLPDDFSGDEVKNDYYTKPKVTIGGSVFVKPEIKGKLGGSLSGTLSLGVFNDNYTGIGATIGANAGLTIGLINGSDGTSGLGMNAGLGISSSTQTGVDVTPSLSLSLNNKMTDNNTTSLGMSASLGYNTRSGLKDLTLGASFSVSGNVSKKEGDMLRNLRGSTSLDLGGSSMSFNTDPFYPKPQIAYKTTSGSFTPSIGGSAFLGFIGGGGTGYVNVREVKDKTTKRPAYGFLYSERGKTKPDAMMDFTREKDNPIIPELPNLAMPVHTPDMFSFSSQSGAGQFRLYRGGTGVFFDDKGEDVSKSTSVGFDLGFGAIFHGGVSFYQQNSKSVTQKWSKENPYLNKGDFQENSGVSLNDDPVFFRQVGEKTIDDPAVLSLIQGETPVAVNIAGKTAQEKFRNFGALYSPIRKTSKQPRRAAIGFLTAEEASKKGAGLNRFILRYDFLPSNFTNPSTPSPAAADSILRTSVGSHRAKHHISEFKVTDEVGKTSWYGIPSYNLKQFEYTFAVGKNPSNLDVNKNLVGFTPSGTDVDTKNKGVDWYYTKQEQPAYATSYLLTGITSPDYVDCTNNGITDDDRGTAIRFNYSKLPYNIKWRTPVSNANLASYNKGLLADPEDEKGSIVYGEKEVWYVQSIETKTQVVYFILEDRDDALGVVDWRGGIDNSNRQKRLKKIVQYSKGDLTTPIKSIIFTYSYRLCPGVTNHATAGGGKLTLDKLHFLYRNSPKGAKHYYEFDYKNDAGYQYIASDRWGTYKPAAAHSGTPFAALRNDEFPYTIQEKTKADNYSQQWLLNKIKLPTGGEINVEYESDDYAYVQNKRAMTMVKPDMLVDLSNNPTDLINARKVVIPLTTPLPGNITSLAEKTKWFKNTYLNGSDYIFGKLFVKIANKLNVTGHEYDFVVGYAKVQEVDVISGKAYLRLEDITEGSVTVNPYAVSAWQKMRMEYPKYAYPGYENRPTSNDPMSTFVATISAIFNAFKTLGELKDNFYERAKRKGFASQVDLSKSFFRITEQTGKKFGGGCRVKRVKLSDNWLDMVGANNGVTATYGTEYDYTIKENNNTISSGVASYEPSLGGEENPFRQPIPYMQKIKGALNNLFYLEQPFGEQYFPGPSVGYRKVTERHIDETGTADSQNEMGWKVHEFYTAKEFPTRVSTTPMQKYENGPRNKSSLFGGFQIHELVLSQGYAIYLNDMHGKLKSEKTYDKTGSLISSVENVYYSSQQGEGEWKLNNAVQVIDETGAVSSRNVGTEIEMYVDMRESEFSNYGESINLGVDVIPFIWGALPIPHWPKKNNDEYRLFRSASVVKVVQSFGLVQKVIKVQNGSTATLENIAFDPIGGEVLITKGNNEYKQDIYTVNIPAYWMQSQMGGAYKTLNTIIQSLTTNSNGTIWEPAASILQPGDQLLAKDGRLLWVVSNKEVVNGVEASYPTKRLIDKNGNLVLNFSGPAKVVRSGNRNLFAHKGSSIVCMQNPIVNGRLKLASPDGDGDHADLKVIDAKTTLYNEDWAGDYDFPCATCPPGYVPTEDGEWCELVPTENTSQCFSLCKGGFANTYNADGAYLKEYSNSAWVNRRSQFWGGVTCICMTREGSTPADDRQHHQLDSGRVASTSSTTESAEQRSSDCNVTLSGRPCNWCGRLQRSGVWFCKTATNNANINLPTNQWIGIETYVVAPQTKTYYIGYGADNAIRLYVNGSAVVIKDNADETNYRHWDVVPITLTQGKNIIKIEGKNVAASGDNPASIGVEIYNNTYSQLINESGINILFSTDNLLWTNKRVYTYVINANGTTTGMYHCNGAKPDILNDVSCDKIRKNQFNPYEKGFKGNWRAVQSKVFQVNRSYGNEVNSNQAGVNIKKDAHYESFIPYWVFNNFQWNSSPDSRWVSAASMTLYDRYGQELEIKNALNKYNTAQFGFIGNLTTAIASNAKNREIFAEGFEDINFRLINRGRYKVCDTLTYKMDGYAAYLSNTVSHTGKYSLQLGTTVYLNTRAHTKEHLTEPYFAISDKGEYLYKQVPGLYYNGFEPSPNKQYLFSVWTKDNAPASKSPSITVYNGGFTIPLTWKATVEGWKLFEGSFFVPSYITNFGIAIYGNSSIYIDDMRIMPNDAEMKTFAYDESTLRLMAELDENNFATFYQYDEEGTVNQVKRETEKGIVTLKETRSTLKRKN